MAKLLLANPLRRRAAPKRRRRSPSRAVASVTRVTRRYRRNPIGRPKIMDQVQSAAIGAAGALAVDVALAKLPIPATMKTGVMGSATQGIVSIGIGMLVAKVGKNAKMGRQLAEGGLTVALHGAMKKAVGPTLGVAGYDDGLLGWDDGLLGFQDLDDGMGFYNAAPVSMNAYDFGDDDDDF